MLIVLSLLILGSGESAQMEDRELSGHDPGILTENLLTGMRVVTSRLSTLPEHLSSPQIFSGIRVTRSLVVCVCFADR